ncbi:hypothetical protein ACHHYP_13597 [Achlya hypogyna]|uniref:RING-type domain-containing protein n=1 Tax=Achlya hypogyna TaxID=1202772 RepID=A0A1V9ZFS6_ACHHY|nr:hypothetical protein ACHHYP_13597 [Achlya hypogyna]
MEAALKALVGKPPSSKELRRALEPDLFVPLASNTPGQSVAAFTQGCAPLTYMVVFQSPEKLQHALSVCSIGIPDVQERWLPLIRAYLDLPAISFLAIPAADRSPVPWTSTADDGKLVHLVSLGSPVEFSPTSIALVLESLLRLTGLATCGLFECLMSSSPSLMLCPICLRKLSLAVPHFNIVRRYEALAAFFHQHPVLWAGPFHQWCLDRLGFITNGAKGGGAAAPPQRESNSAAAEFDFGPGMESIDLDDVVLDFGSASDDDTTTILELLPDNAGISAFYNDSLLTDAHKQRHQERHRLCIPTPPICTPTQRARSYSLPSATTEAKMLRLPVALAAEPEAEPSPHGSPEQTSCDKRSQAASMQRRLQECLVRTMSLSQELSQKSRALERQVLVSMQLQGQVDNTKTLLDNQIQIVHKMERRLALANERARVANESAPPAGAKSSKTTCRGYATLKQRMNALRVELAKTTREVQLQRGDDAVLELQVNELEALEATLETGLRRVRDGLRQHYRQAIEARSDLCIVCFAEKVAIVLLPCRHRVLCGTCAVRVTSCPVDRVPIEDLFPTFGAS